MSRQIALEWDDREVRVVVAQCRGGEVRLEHALTAPLPPSDGPLPPETVGGALAELLSSSGLAKGEAIVVIGRASIELRRMKLPPAPPEELPEMARFQAVREFTNFGDDWALDYEVLSSSADDATWVLAAVLSPQMLKYARKVAEAAGLTMGHLLLRPFAAASLFESSPLRREGATPLLIDTAGAEADLTALADNRVVFTRTVKLSSDTDDTHAFGAALTSEIRRTMVAAQNQQAGYKVDQIVLCDDQASGGAIGKQIEGHLSTSVHLLDPFEVVNGSALREKPAAPGRFASLVGALLEESRDQRHAIDFLDPKRRPPPPDSRRTAVLAGLAAALVVLAVVGGIWWTLSSLERRAAALTREINSNEELLKRYAAKEAELKEIEAFLDAEVVWLDELERLSLAAPPPGEAIVTLFRANLIADNTGRINIEGVVSEASQIEAFETRLRDEAHRVDRTDGTFDERGELPWRIKETITIDPQKLRPAGDPEQAAATPESTETEAGR